MKFWKYIPNLVLLVLLTGGCSLRERADVRGIKLSILGNGVPSTKIQKKTITAAEIISGIGLNPISDPVSYSDINCFAINVTGPGMIKDPRFSCGSTPSEVGISLGFIPINETELELLVPIGMDRKIQLIGIKSQVGCLNFETIFANHLFETNAYSHAFILGEVTIDVFDDTSATLNAVFDSSKKFMEACGQNQSCPIGMTWNSNSNSCISNCGAGATLDPNLGCTCPDGLNLDLYNNCVTCPVQTSWNSETKSCECDQGIQCLDLSCESGQLIAGMNVQTGAIVDQYQIQCKSVSQGVMNDEIIQGPLTGGYGGGPDSFTCPSGSLISQISVGSSPYNWNGAVSTLVLECKKLVGEVTQEEINSYSRSYCLNNPVSQVYSCPAGQFAYGIKALPMQLWGSNYTGAIYGVKCRAPNP